jgi:hypothetical protein
MANPSPAITFQLNYTIPTTTQIGPAYASRSVGMMNVNSGQTNPIALAGTTDPKTLLPFPGATAPSILAGFVQQYLQSARGYQNQNANIRANFQNEQSQYQYNGNQMCNAGQQYQPAGTWENPQIGSQCNYSMSPTVGMSGYQGGSNLVPTFTLYGSQAVYVKNTYCAANSTNPLLGGNATSDRALLTVLSIS